MVKFSQIVITQPTTVRELDIANAIATTTYSVNGVDYKREYIASQPAQVIAIRISSNVARAYTLQYKTQQSA